MLPGSDWHGSRSEEIGPSQPSLPITARLQDGLVAEAARSRRTRGLPRARCPDETLSTRPVNEKPETNNRDKKRVMTKR